MKINRLDKFASDLYVSLGIDKIENLSIDNLSLKFGLYQYYTDLNSCIIRDEQADYVIVNSTLSSQRQRAEFFHELAHYVLNHYPSPSLSLTEYFEGKADTLMLYLAIPLHLLQQSEIDINDPNYVQKISEEFGMEFDFTFKRLNKLRDLRDK